MSQEKKFQCYGCCGCVGLGGCLHLQLQRPNLSLVDTLGLRCCCCMIVVVAPPAIVRLLHAVAVVVIVAIAVALISAAAALVVALSFRFLLLAFGLALLILVPSPAMGLANALRNPLATPNPHARLMPGTKGLACTGIIQLPLRPSDIRPQSTPLGEFHWLTPPIGPLRFVLRGLV